MRHRPAEAIESPHDQDIAALKGVQTLRQAGPVGPRSGQLSLKILDAAIP
jgi:hypothetical protein